MRLGRLLRACSTCELREPGAGDVARLTVVVVVRPATSKPGCKARCLVASSTWLINENEGDKRRTRPSRQSGNGRPDRRRVATGPGEQTSCGPAATRSRAVRDGQREPEAPTRRSPRTTRWRRLSACPRSRPTRTISGSRRRSPRPPGNARTSEVCVAALGQNCPAGSRADFGSSGAVIRFTFLRLGRRTAGDYQITKVFHDGRRGDVGDVLNGRRVRHVDRRSTRRRDLDDRRHGRDERLVGLVR